MLYLSCFVAVPAQSGPAELYISTNRYILGPLYQPHSSYRRGSDFMRYKVLKQRKAKKIQQENRKWLPFRTPVSCSTQAKITIACFCNCLDPSSDRPNSRGPPSILSTWTTLTWRGFSAAPASRGSPLYRYTCQQFLCTFGTMLHRHCWNAVLSRLLDPNFWCVLFLFQKVFVWYKLKKSNMYIFPQISENRILVGC